jgi:elongation factor G
MKLEIIAPEEHLGDVMNDLNGRRGRIREIEARDAVQIVHVDVPLAEMFGYSTVLRSLTQGKAEFTMEFSSYKQVPKSVSEELIKAYQEEKKNQ